MRRAMVLVLIAAVTAACDRAVPGIQLPTGRAAALVNDWRAVQTLGHGTRVLVTRQGLGILDGQVASVSDTELEIRGPGWQEHVPRAEVLRVVRIESMSATGAKKGLIAGLFLGGLILIASHGTLWPPVVWDPPLFAAGGALTGLAEQRQVLVYERLHP